MSEVWQYGIPITIAVGGLVSLWLYKELNKEHWWPLAYYHLGNGLLLILTAIYYTHQTATSPLIPNTIGTQVAYLLELVAVMFSFLYAVVIGVMNVINALGDSGRRWMK